MKFLISNKCDYVKRAFIRFKLKEKYDDETLKYILKLIGNIKIEYTIGGSEIFKIDNLFFNYAIMSKTNDNIKNIDVKQFQEEHTIEQIKHLCHVCDNNSICGNDKYYFEDKNGFYLDIPVLDNFYFYNGGTKLVALKHRNTTCIISNISQFLHQFLCDEINFGFEENVYVLGNTRKQLATSTYELITLQSNVYESRIFKNNNSVDILVHSYNNKFIFLTLYHMTNDIHNEPLPQLLNITLTMKNNVEYVIPLENISFEQYDDKIVYGISVDENTSMEKWLKFTNECTSNILSKLNDDYSTPKNNINSNNYNGIYKCVNIEKIKMIFTDVSQIVNIEITTLIQNIQRIMYGMSGLQYCN